MSSYGVNNNYQLSYNPRYENVYKDEMSTAIRRKLVSTDFAQLHGLWISTWREVGLVGVENVKRAVKGAFLARKKPEKFTNLQNDNHSADPCFFLVVWTYFGQNNLYPLHIRCTCLLSTEHSNHGERKHAEPCTRTGDAVKQASRVDARFLAFSPLIRCAWLRFLRHITGLHP